MAKIDVFGQDFDLDSGELLALLNCLFKQSEFSDKTGDHTVVFERGKLEVTFDAKSGRMRSIGPNQAKDDQPARKLLEAIDEELVGNDPPRAKARQVVFAKYAGLNGPPEPIRFGRSHDFRVQSIDTSLPMPGHVGHPCVLSFCYVPSDFNLLNAYRQEQAFRRARNLLTGLGAASTPFQFSNPYGSEVQTAWCHTLLGQTPPEEPENYAAVLGFRLSDGDPSESASGVDESKTFEKLHEDLDTYELLDDVQKELFQIACSWLHRAMTTDSTTLRLLCITTMVESLLEPSNTGSCECCGQPQYSTHKRFVSFITNLLGEDAKKWAKDLYATRSKASHQGIWVADEENPNVSMIIPSNHRSKKSVRLLQDRASMLLQAWLQPQGADS